VPVCLDIAAELHAVLYLQSRRTISLLASAVAEWDAGLDSDREAEP
jgi:hypothetical protein